MEADPGSIPQWTGSIIQFVILVILLLLSAFFSASETAFTSLGRIRLKNMVNNGVKGAEMVEKVLSDKQKLLSCILIGNNLVNITATAVATSLSIQLSRGSSVVVGLATIVLTLVILVFGEITPKTMASMNTERFALLVAGPIYGIIKIFSPTATALNLVTGTIIHWFGGDSEKNRPMITEAELKTIVDVGHAEGVLEMDEKIMIHNVFEFGDARAKDVMVPRMDMVALDLNTPWSEIIRVFDEERFTRIPIYKETNDNIIGILNLKDFIFSETEKDFSIEKYLRKPYFTYENKQIAELFTLMRTRRIPMVIVLDEYGGTSGLLTLEDIVEEIVGDISDEFDDLEEEIEVIRDHEYMVDGSVKIDDVNDMLGTKLESEDYDSIGGYVIGLFSRIPQVGEQVSEEAAGIRFIVEEVEKNRIEKLRIHTS